MNFKVEITSYFKKRAKPLLKKYPSLKRELEILMANLEFEPIQGNSIGNHCYKIRISIASKNKGKSGGGRVIINVQVVDEIVYMLTIYDKSEQEDITDLELRELLNLLP
jgi:mRNA-degrading endonuclease RelE of RelBE toxin-antitoxin system